MLSSLFQLSGSILLAYMVITRSIISSINATYSNIRVLGEVNPKTLEILKENNYFKIGLGYLILGYIFQIADFDSTFLNSLDRFDRVFIVSLLAIFLSLLGIIIGNSISKNEFNKIDPEDIEKIDTDGLVLKPDGYSFNANNKKVSKNAKVKASEVAEEKTSSNVEEEVNEVKEEKTSSGVNGK